MTLLFYDTETTGLPLWHDPSDDPRQPHIASLAAQLCRDDGQKVGSIDLIVRPDGWEITWETVQIHGISQEMALSCGVDEETVLTVFRRFSALADARVAFNDPFDARIIRIAAKRYGVLDWADETWKDMKRHCVMQMAKPIMNMAPTDAMMATGRKTSKNPKLEEAYWHFFGEKHDKAHDAAADVMATKQIYFEILRRQGQGVPPEAA